MASWEKSERGTNTMPVLLKDMDGKSVKKYLAGKK